MIWSMVDIKRGRGDVAGQQWGRGRDAAGEWGRGRDAAGLSELGRIKQKNPTYWPNIPPNGVVVVAVMVTGSGDDCRGGSPRKFMRSL